MEESNNRQKEELQQKIDDLELNYQTAVRNNFHFYVLKEIRYKIKHAKEEYNQLK